MAKILLVEDDNNLREIYEARLQAEGYTIVSAKDGEEALVVAKRERPDLIMADVMMPRVSGFEMLDIIRNTDGLRDVRVIMLTALGQAEDKVRADKLGADRYLVKSQVTLEDIVKVAAELLGGPNDTANNSARQATATPNSAAVSVPPISTPTPATPAPQTTQAPVAPPPQPTPLMPVASAPAPAPGSSTSVQTQPAPTTLTTSGLPASNPPSTPPVSLRPTPAPSARPTAPQPTGSTQPSTAASLPQSLATETAAVEAQIKQFTDSQDQPTTAQPRTVPPAQTPQVPTTPTPPSASPTLAPTPQVAQAPVQDQTRDQLVANAVNDLVTQTQTPPSPVSPVAPPVLPAPAAQPATPPPPSDVPATPQIEKPKQVADDDGVTIAHKKIIQPLNNNLNEPPNFDELLAKEEEGVPTPPPQATPPAPSMPTTPHPPGHVIMPSGPQNGVDPNSIAL